MVKMLAFGLHQRIRRLGYAPLKHCMASKRYDWDILCNDTT